MKYPHFSVKGYRTPLKSALISLFSLFLAQVANAQMLTGYETYVAPQTNIYAPLEDKVSVDPLPTNTYPASVPSRFEKPEPVILEAAPKRSSKNSQFSPFLTSRSALTQMLEKTPATKNVKPLTPETSKDNTVISTSDPVDFEAESLFYDDVQSLVRASGDVRIAQSRRVLTADSVAYNLAQDRVNADGSVVLVDESGDVYRADSVELTDGQKAGQIKNLNAELFDGSRFYASHAERRINETTVLRDAAYTPCQVCEGEATPYVLGDGLIDGKENSPPWQIRADKVTHDKAQHKIAYNNARFEVYGRPILYAPYFSHPDGTIKRKSGFLSPMGGFRSELGAFIQSDYYWSIAPDKDLTLGVMAMTEQAPMVLGQWRQRWDDASLEFNAGITHADYVDRIAGEQVRADADVRGHVIARALWDMDDEWRSGVNINWASDDQYMRQYNFMNRDVLQNEVFAERFFGRNYTVARLLAFKDTRVRDFSEDQPAVLPEVISSYRGDPNSVPILGGRWGLDASFLGLQRSGNEQDMNRFSARGEWERNYTTPMGILAKANVSGRADLYNTRDRNVANSTNTQSSTTTEARFIPAAHFETRYPFARNFGESQVVVEPVASVTFSPNIDVNNDIPNEDSQDAQISAANIFKINRFPGLDRVEDQSRATYGLRTGLYALNGSEITSFIGQSYRFEKDDNPFPTGSGLSQQSSDIVGQITAKLGEDYAFDYRYQLGSETLSSQRHEIDAEANIGKFSLRGQYIFANALGGTNINENREQIGTDIGYYINPAWRVRSGARHDLGEDQGLRRAYLGLDHFGQCVSWSLMGVRNLTDDFTGQSDTEITFRIGLKNLGEFEQSDLRLSCSKE